jgi:imidazoleglycerol-phosphate dehydratase/histidinol-phosphatase
MKKKVLFLDRDGTLIVEPPDEQIDSFEKWEFLPGVFRWLGSVCREMDYELVMVTNQDGLGTEKFPEEKFYPVQNKMLTFLQNEGIVFQDILIDRSFAHENKNTRKPGTGLLTKYLYGNYDLSHSFVIGDRRTDVELAKNLGAKSIRISSQPDPHADYTVQNWEEIYKILKQEYRKTVVHRTTRETDIFLELNLFGKGFCDIQTGIGFFDHMLEQIARHGNVDMILKAKGDLHVDEHHLVEDTGIVLGQAVHDALGSRKGIQRYGFALPMDDSSAQVLIDFGGRPYLVWNVEFSADRIGGILPEMFEHFFRSFCDHARCNLHVKAEGKNHHHKIEAVFKSFAKALRMAIEQNPVNDTIPSSKGVL